MDWALIVGPVVVGIFVSSRSACNIRLRICLAALACLRILREVFLQELEFSTVFRAVVSHSAKLAFLSAVWGLVPLVLFRLCFDLSLECCDGRSKVWDMRELPKNGN
jgi:hypothetical protein